ncbi:MAG: amidohydrolase family protein [Chloroflexi bacterium]|nr:amidohydrolase family protein [Chloroflexota bacterium]MBU1747737.1 amidohydrolase family protein [Chloroflexota bacterium]
MIIDFHTHIFPPEWCARREPYLDCDRWFCTLYSDPQARMATAEDLIGTMDRAGVDKAVAFGFAWADEGLCREHNAYVLDAVRRYQGRLVGFAVAQPLTGHQAIADVEWCLDRGLRGVGELMPDGQGYTWDDDDVQVFVQSIAQRGVPLLTHSNEGPGHTYPGKGNVGPAMLHRLAQRYPNLTLVSAHWGGGLAFYELMPEVRAACANVYYDTAASVYLYDDAVYRVAEQCAPGKALWGSDYPLVRPERYLKRIRALGLAPDVEAALLGGTAARLLRLEETADV